MYRQIVIRKGKERSIDNRHPWIFHKSLAWLPEYENGEIVEVVSSPGQVFGYGFFSPASRIICRVFEFTNERRESFTKDYFRGRIMESLELRRRQIDLTATDCYRVINAEGDFLPGLVVDAYGETAVIQVLIKGIELILDDIADILQDAGYKNICLKNPGQHQAENVTNRFAWLRGGIAGKFNVRENNLHFSVDPEGGQKTGFFLDQRNNRDLVREMARGRTVLNAFSYSGGFSVYAIAGGAAMVHSVDISAPAIALLEENVKMNVGGEAQHKSFCHDCFDFLRTMQADYYDMIILDPPAFAKTAANVEKAARGYKDINLQAMKRIKKDSLIFTFSCSQHIPADLFRKIIFSAAADSGRNVRILGQLQGAPDHPVSIYHPEGEYLKGLLLHVM